MDLDEVHIDDAVEAIRTLSDKDRRILDAIYDSPGCMITSLELERKLGVLRTQIGQLGKKLAVSLQLEDVGSYRDGKRIKVKFYSVIGEYYAEGGWAMNAFLRRAIKKMRNERTAVRKKVMSKR